MKKNNKKAMVSATKLQVSELGNNMQVIESAWKVIGNSKSDFAKFDCQTIKSDSNALLSYVDVCARHKKAGLEAKGANMQKALEAITGQDALAKAERKVLKARIADNTAKCDELQGVISAVAEYDYAKVDYAFTRAFAYGDATVLELSDETKAILDGYAKDIQKFAKNHVETLGKIYLDTKDSDDVTTIEIGGQDYKILKTTLSAIFTALEGKRVYCNRADCVKLISSMYNYSPKTDKDKNIASSFTVVHANTILKYACALYCEKVEERQVSVDSIKTVEEVQEEKQRNSAK